MKTKLIFIASFILFGLFLLLVFPELIFSPGKLHAKHAEVKKCSACHEPFTKPGGESCAVEGCHDSAYWGKFKGITTGHLVSAGCIKCHTDHKGANGKITLFDPHRNVTVKSNCLDCHRLGATHSPVKTENCRNCHIMRGWRPARFDHAAARQDQSCAHCHKLGVKHFTTGKNCGDCHTTSKWKPATFDHRLVKAGDNCTHCHKLDARHFATEKNCDDCHTTSKWKPATLDHRFPTNHASRRMNDCRTCHPESLDKHDCYSGCHEHTVFKVRAGHLEEGIFRTSDCVKCHPTGREHEGERRGHRERYEDDDDD